MFCGGRLTDARRSSTRRWNVRGTRTRNLIVVGAAGLAVLGLAGCGEQSTPGDSASQSDLKIVEQVQIDQDGAAIKPVAGAAAPADPAGDGKATCAPVALAMAGPITGADAPFGANVRNGAQLAIDLHNAANPGCQVSLKAFDTEGLVMHCGSFAKSLAPGYRVGWVAAGRYAQKVERLKLMTSLSPSMPAQAAIADYLQHGGYDRHLRQLRKTLADNIEIDLDLVWEPAWEPSMIEAEARKRLGWD